jgi:hypothetical protein
MGYRGHNDDGEVTARVDKRQRGRTPQPLWRWMKRRAAVEPSIGHLKSEDRLERNRLKGVAGDAFNAMLSAAAMNFQKLLGSFWVQFPAPPAARMGLDSGTATPPSIAVCSLLKADFSGSTIQYLRFDQYRTLAKQTFSISHE